MHGLQVDPISNMPFETGLKQHRHVEDACIEADRDS